MKTEKEIYDRIAERMVYAPASPHQVIDILTEWRNEICIECMTDAKFGFTNILKLMNNEKIRK